jgi:methionyl aminopeptidase
MKRVTSRWSRRASSAATGSIELKSPRELELMRASGRIVRLVLDEMRRLARPGVPTAVLGDAAARIIAEHDAEALFLGVRIPSAKIPFPAAVCVSVNEEVVHGVPGPRVLRDGDMVSVDCGVRLRGYCGDAATTIPVGQVRPEVQRLLDVTSKSLDLAVEAMRPGRMWSEIAGVIQRTVERAGFSVVREFVGHGIGRSMHEEPKVPNYVDRDQRKGDFELTPGLVLAVEPMVTMGSPRVRHGDATGWPQVTCDGGWSAHFEHTVAVTATGVDILTDGR